MEYPPLQEINAKPARPPLSIFIRVCSAQRTALSADCSRQSPVNVLTVRTGRRHRLFFRRQKAPQGTRGKA